MRLKTVNNIQPSNDSFYGDFKNGSLKITYSFNPKIFANGKRIYIFTPEATPSELKTYAPKLHISWLNMNDKHNWLIYSQHAQEMLTTK